MIRGTLSLVGVPETAARLGVCHATVYQWIYEGKIHADRPQNGHYLVPTHADRPEGRRCQYCGTPVDAPARGRASCEECKAIHATARRERRRTKATTARVV